MINTFLLTDFRQHKYLYVLFTLQCTVALFLMGYAGNMITDLNIYLDACRHVEILKDSYVLRNMNTQDEEEYLINAHSDQHVLYNAYWSIMDNSESIIYTVSPIDNLYIKNAHFPMSSSDENGTYLEYIEVSKSFLDVFNVQSTLLSVDDFFSCEGSTIPVLLGNAFIGEVDIGESFIDYSGKKYVVAGFIQNHPYYLRPSSNAQLQDMDRLVVMPLLKSSYTTEIDCYCALSWTYYASNLRERIQEILDRVNSIGYAWYEKSIADHIDWIETYEFSRSMRVVVIAIIFLIFSVLSMIASLYIIMQESWRKYTIHYLCGARLSTLIIRLLSSISICVSIATSIAWTLNGFTARLYIGLLALIILLLTVPYPIITFHRYGIAELLRRTE